MRNSKAWHLRPLVIGVGVGALSNTLLELWGTGQGPNRPCSVAPGLFGGVFWPQSFALFTFCSFSWSVDPWELPGVTVCPAGWTDCFEELTNRAWFVLATNSCFTVLLPCAGQTPRPLPKDLLAPSSLCASAVSRDCSPPGK